MTGATYIPFDEARTKSMQLIRTQENPSFGLLILVGINTGLRYSDLSQLTYGQLRSKAFTLTEQKTGKKRELDINDNIQQGMKYFEDTFKYPDDYRAFKSQKNTVYSNKHVNRLLKSYFTGDRLSSHSLRKTFGRRVYDNNGKSEEALLYLSEIFNHKDVSTTRRYLGIRREEIKNIYMSL